MKMVSTTSLATEPRRVCAFIFVILFSTSLATTVEAQFGVVDTDPASGLGGRSTIDGRIFYPSGRPLDKRIRIQLSSAKGDQTATSDDNGKFVFRRLPGATYILTIDAGEEYQPVIEKVDIREMLGSRLANVIIQLQPKVSIRNKPAVIGALSLENVPKPALKLYQTALETVRKGDRKAAIGELRSALAIHPEFVMALNELGVQHLQLGQFNEASEAFLSALKFAPDEFSPRLNYGIALVQRRQFAEAESELRRAVEKNSSSGIAHLYRGRALIGLGNSEEAEKSLLHAIKSGDEAGSLAHRYLGALYHQRGDDVRAIKELETFLRLAPQDKDADSIRAIVKRMREQSTKKE